MCPNIFYIDKLFQQGAEQTVQGADIILYIMHHSFSYHSTKSIFDNGEKLIDHFF